MEEMIYGARELSPDAISVSVLDGYVLRIRFANGELRDFDAKPMLSRKCYRELNNEVLFRTAHVKCGTVAWANGSDIDPDWLYEDSIAAN